MSLDGQQYLTREGLAKLKVELKQLKTVKRKEIALRIQEAKELGDLSENAEYAEAKSEQGFIEGRIIEIENTLKNAVVISEEKSSGLVKVGSSLKVKTNDNEMTLTIVGSNEANPGNGLISNESPLGQALLGHKVGDQVEVKVPAGVVKYKILSIS
ncbi:MAG: Transcription elongation factor GreA [Parcubacteria group bacterium GW2011_GWD2_43_10]|uniref:Transcription elongation factor GreA n=5 Tax=Candidatus Vebleniibacteriota TaxID=1817921 RepID=A0A1G2Q450_9BACT|nr:MAG: Transcription elongation factor GreA [Parcubacteria group bacterium GW2011_GWA2_42_80]KKS78708.1 MAG: Transcription elongation factor GreA [Parcubacteria group bacterium GW2011_GWD1_42_9]KKS81768.1 MAG: Transcription elongation factor GreA [Parcubacteria group bacterium GW2011_GWD2_43_10]KKS92503.1 MAG: Transcription elongation factor GreA [Parcubacteria group bacterium GW2011_GWE2_43_12]KKT14186.1 MAG: Transcription elongation factor GreA [Parcubacteria group bacterium GW2011_GWA1_43_2